MSEDFTMPLMAKAIAGLGGLIGGTAFMVFYRPTNVWDAAVRSGLSTTTAILGCAPLLEWMQLSTTTDNVLAAAAFIGFVSWCVLSFAANILMNIQDEKVELKLPEFLIRKDKK